MLLFDYNCAKVGAIQGRERFRHRRKLSLAPASSRDNLPGARPSGPSQKARR